MPYEKLTPSEYRAFRDVAWGGLVPVCGIWALWGVGVGWSLFFYTLAVITTTCWAVLVVVLAVDRWLE